MRCARVAGGSPVDLAFVGKPWEELGVNPPRAKESQFLSKVWAGRSIGEHLCVLLAAGAFAAGLCFITPTVTEGLDYVAIWKPTFQFLTDAVREGHVPLWNPYMNLGRPFLADMPNQAFYPPVYLICLGQGIGVFLLVWLHCLVAIFGMRSLAGALGVGRWQSYFMAFSFLACGPLTTHWMTGQVTYAGALCYMPALFYSAMRTGDRWQSRRIAGYALLLALQLLCIPQVFWFSAVGQAVFIVGRALRWPWREAVRDVGRGLFQFGAACAWGAGMMAVALMPFVELIQQSNRSANSPEFVNSFNLAWRELGYVFSPLFSGVSWESNLFVGAIIVVSGCAGLCLVRERNVRGLLGVLMVALLLALGDRTPLFGLFYEWLPGFASFRIHARDAMLAVFALTCAAGIWLSRPHPSLRAAWTRLFGVPIRWALVGLLLVHSLDLLHGTWAVKRIISRAALCLQKFPLENSFERTLVAESRKAGLMGQFQPPPRVLVPSSLVSPNHGMIDRYSNCDASLSLLLRRPWDYLHAALGITPGFDKGCLSSQVYDHGPFPYPDLGLSVGFDRQTRTLTVTTNPAPRAFLVYAAEVADYATILNRLGHGHDVHRCALLEEPLAEPLPRESTLPATPALIRRFELNSLVIEVEAKEKALLVLAEAWYPGWRATRDGRICPVVPANGWMRAIPVPAGRHQVRVYFHQNGLLPGLLISLASATLMLVAVSKRRASLSDKSTVIKAVGRPPSTDENGGLEQGSPSPAAPSGASSVLWRRLRAFGAGVLLVGLMVAAARQRASSFDTLRTYYDAFTHVRIGKVFSAQNQTAQAITHYTEALRLNPDAVEALNNLAWIRAGNAPAEFHDVPEAVRLAERACQLTDYTVPATMVILATAYAKVGRVDDAVAMMRRVRERALANGQSELAEASLKFLDLHKARLPIRTNDLPAAER